MINEIKVAEHFYSIQGEGVTAGNPAVFLRLSSCNLMCGGQDTEKDKKLHDGATWRCDTIESWLHGTRYSLQELTSLLCEKYMYQFNNGAHLIVTGGEPLLQQTMLLKLLRAMRENFPWLFIEIETNGTIMPDKEIALMTNLFNVSPKLSNSGMPEKRRIVGEVLRWLASRSHVDHAIFKFVVSDAADWEEIEHDYIRPFDIPQQQTWLMPACDARSQIKESWPIVAEIAKKKKTNFSPRLQVAIWDQTTGV